MYSPPESDGFENTGSPWGIHAVFLFASQLSGCSGSVCRGAGLGRSCRLCLPGQVIRRACLKLVMTAGEEIAKAVAVPWALG